MDTQFSPEMIRLAALGVGAVMLVTITIFHGAGLHHVVRRYMRGEKKILARRPHEYSVSLIFAYAVFWMLSLHLAEIFFWSFGLWKLGLVRELGDSFYFAANAYTTLGFGKVAVAEDWRVISPVIAISGLFTFAWTASTLVSVVTSNQNLHDKIESELAKEVDMRARERMELRWLHEEEREEERALRLKEQHEAAGKSFLERLALIEKERRDVARVRAAEEAQARELHRTEREAETHLGEPDAVEEEEKKS